jgi:thiol-disulfide isomerase/thioredoxin
MALSAAKFSQGMTTQQYIDIIKVNKDPFCQIHDGVDIPASVLDYFNGLEEPVNLAVFTSDWCGDAMSTTPAVLRLADASDNIRLSVFNRDDELELANSFLPEHRAGTVPVFVVFDGEMGEIARFIETARSLVPTIDAMDEMVAQAAASVADEGERRQQTRGRRTAHRVSKAGEWGAVILNEFQQLVADGMARSSVDRPAEGGTQWPPQE